MSRPWRKHPSQQFFHPILSDLHISSGAMTAVKYEIDQVLKVGGDYRYSSTVRAYYRRWRKMHSLADRCDNKDCMFHTQPLLWSNEKLPLILDHKSGNRDDNRAENLRFLCPNCDSQNTETRAGANVGGSEDLMTALISGSVRMAVRMRFLKFRQRSPQKHSA